MQHIDTLTTIVPVVDEDHIPRQLNKIGERDEDLRSRVRMGYVLTHTVAISGPDFTTFVDTFVRTDDEDHGRDAGMVTTDGVPVSLEQDDHIQHLTQTWHDLANQPERSDDAQAAYGELIREVDHLHLTGTTLDPRK